jgi:cytidine deaminase
MKSELAEKLLAAAKLARRKAYVPYSSFGVGCALITADGSLYTGCNVENASYGLTNCAERTALFNMVVQQEVVLKEEGRRYSVEALLVIADTEQPISPCGACRQVMVELCSPNTTVYLANMKGDLLQKTVEQLLPASFHSDFLNKGEST